MLLLLLHYEFGLDYTNNCFNKNKIKFVLQKYQLDRVALHDSKRATYDHTKKCAENYIMLGQTDRAVQLLLETEPDNESYYTDSLRLEQLNHPHQRKGI